MRGRFVRRLIWLRWWTYTTLTGSIAWTSANKSCVWAFKDRSFQSEQRPSIDDSEMCGAGSIRSFLINLILERDLSRCCCAASGCVLWQVIYSVWHHARGNLSRFCTSRNTHVVWSITTYTEHQVALTASTSFWPQRGRILKPAVADRRPYHGLGAITGHTHWRQPCILCVPIVWMDEYKFITSPAFLPQKWFSAHINWHIVTQWCQFKNVRQMHVRKKTWKLIQKSRSFRAFLLLSCRNQTLLIKRNSLLFHRDTLWGLSKIEKWSQTDPPHWNHWSCVHMMLSVRRHPLPESLCILSVHSACALCLCTHDFIFAGGGGS